MNETSGVGASREALIEYCLFPLNIENTVEETPKSTTILILSGAVPTLAQNWYPKADRIIVQSYAPNPCLSSYSRLAGFRMQAQGAVI
jgi:hypothetical protein